MTKPIRVELTPGTEYASQEECQAANLELWAQMIARCIRAGLASGRYIIVDGKIEFNRIDPSPPTEDRP